MEQRKCLDCFVWFLPIFYLPAMDINRILYATLRLSIAFYIIGLLFKIMHWPNGGSLLLVSTIAIILAYPFRFMHKKEKSELDYIKLGLVLFWGIHSILYNYHLPGQRFFQYGTIVLFVAWLIMGGPTNFVQAGNNEKPRKLLYLSLFLLGACMVSTAIGSLFKIMHWPYADVLLILGLSGTALWFLIFLRR